jgi:hypothetical protein
LGRPADLWGRRPPRVRLPFGLPEGPLTFHRKKDAVARRTRDGVEPHERADRDEPPGQDGSKRDDFVCVTPYGDEELVADVRHGIEPRQMVERKLLALLGGGSPGLVAQAAGGLSNPRRVPGSGP